MSLRSRFDNDTTDSIAAFTFQIPPIVRLNILAAQWRDYLLKRIVLRKNPTIPFNEMTIAKLYEFLSLVDGYVKAKGGIGIGKQNQELEWMIPLLQQAWGCYLKSNYQIPAAAATVSNSSAANNSHAAIWQQLGDYKQQAQPTLVCATSFSQHSANTKKTVRTKTARYKLPALPDHQSAAALSSATNTPTTAAPPSSPAAPANTPTAAIQKHSL